METTAMRFAISSDVRSDTDDDGTAILHITQDKVYTIVGVGSAIWSKLVRAREGLAPHEIVETLSTDFTSVPRQQIEGDVQRFLSTFQQKGFIKSERESSRLRKGVHGFATAAFSLLARTATSLLLKLRLQAFAAFCGLATVDFLVKLVSFNSLYTLVRNWPLSKRRGGGQTIDRINAAVTRALTWYPKQAMCLQRSTVTTILLRSSGVPAQLVIGCQKLPFLVHAWVEADDEVVNDSPRVRQIHKVLDRC